MRCDVTHARTHTHTHTHTWSGLSLLLNGPWSSSSEHRERQRDRDREREIHRQTDTERERAREREREREREIHTHRERNRRAEMYLSIASVLHCTIPGRCRVQGQCAATPILYSLFFNDCLLTMVASMLQALALGPSSAQPCRLLPTSPRLQGSCTRSSSQGSRTDHAQQRSRLRRRRRRWLGLAPLMQPGRVQHKQRNMSGASTAVQR